MYAYAENRRGYEGEMRPSFTMKLPDNHTEQAQKEAHAQDSKVREIYSHISKRHFPRQMGGGNKDVPSIGYGRKPQQSQPPKLLSFGGGPRNPGGDADVWWKRNKSRLLFPQVGVTHAHI